MTDSLTFFFLLINNSLCLPHAMEGRAGGCIPALMQGMEVNVYWSYCQLPCGLRVRNGGGWSTAPFLLTLVLLMCILTQAHQPDNYQSLLPLRLDPIQENGSREGGGLQATEVAMKIWRESQAKPNQKRQLGNPRQKSAGPCVKRPLARSSETCQLCQNSIYPF